MGNTLPGRDSYDGTSPCLPTLQSLQYRPDIQGTILKLVGALGAGKVQVSPLYLLFAGISETVGPTGFTGGQVDSLHHQDGFADK